MSNDAKPNTAELSLSRWPFPLAVFAACTTFPLILLGGLVTTYEVGMAVPDAPTTFGHNMLLFPIADWLRAPFGVFLEHGHRLFGSLVGLVTLLLAAALWSARTRRWAPWLAAFWVAAMFAVYFFQGTNPKSAPDLESQAATAGRFVRAIAMLAFGAIVSGAAAISLWRDRTRAARWLGVLALGLVIVQGGLGALRVALIDQRIAVIHGVVAQGFFAFVVCLAAAQSRRWLAGAPGVESPEAARLRRLAVLTTGFVAAQLALGAMLRHLGYSWALAAHLVVAFLILVHVGLLAKLILIRFGSDTLLVFGIQGVALLVAAQLMLGAGAWATSAGFGVASAPPSGAQVFFATAHVGSGALILAMLAMLTAASFRFWVPATRVVSRERGSRAAVATRPTVSALESRELFMVGGTT
jgi:cytochrome c oxidase assembly protein subunit 15